MFIDESFTSLLFCGIERVYFCNLRDEGVFEFDGMVEGVVWG